MRKSTCRGVSVLWSNLPRGRKESVRVATQRWKQDSQTQGRMTKSGLESKSDTGWKQELDICLLKQEPLNSSRSKKQRLSKLYS